MVLMPTPPAASVVAVKWRSEWKVTWDSSRRSRRARKAPVTRSGRYGVAPSRSWDQTRVARGRRRPWQPVGRLAPGGLEAP